MKIVRKVAVCKVHLLMLLTYVWLYIINHKHAHGVIVLRCIAITNPVNLFSHIFQIGTGTILEDVDWMADYKPQQTAIIR